MSSEVAVFIVLVAFQSSDLLFHTEPHGFIYPRPSSARTGVGRASDGVTEGGAECEGRMRHLMINILVPLMLSTSTCLTCQAIMCGSW